MSATGYGSLDLQGQIARIGRGQAETGKLVAERLKRASEADKSRRDRSLAPVIIAAAVFGAVATLLPIVLRAWGLRS